jgi:hypothetical protein
VTPALPQALKFGFVKVVLQDGFVVWMCALLDDDPSALLGAHTTDIGETLLCDNDVEVVLRLINVRAHGDDTGDTCWVSLRGTSRRCVHDGVFGTGIS